jgi:acyl transferase domain-containing protein
MSKTALLLPGQAELQSEKVLEIATSVPQLAIFVAVISQVVKGLNIHESARDQRQLNSTVTAQLTQFACSAALAEKLMWDADFEADYLVGHSMGEYTALYLAGAFDMATTIRLLTERAKLLASVNNGAMARVRGDPEAVDKLLSEQGCQVNICAINTPQDCTITGLRPDVQASVELLKQAGFAAKMLEGIGVLSHTPLLTKQAEKLAVLLRGSEIRSMNRSVVATNRGEFLPKAKRFELEAYLAEQLVTPVDWLGAVRLLWGRGVRCFVEVGASPFLGRLVSKIYPKAEVIVVSGVDDFAKLD